MTRVMAICLGVITASGLLGAQAAQSGDGRVARPARSTTPRIPPRAESQWTDAERALAKTYTRDGGASNDFRTFLHNPDTVKAMMPFIAYVSGESSLPP